MIEYRYRPDVDGLRGVAVLLVLLFHAGFGVSGGFVGVDVFFVISGFLITGLILKEQEQAKFSLSEFWLRRIRRIAPASLFVATATMVAGFLFLLPMDLEDLAKSEIANLFMMSNVWFWRTTGYFSGGGDRMPLLHFWSLAVEEQFYLVYPLVLIALKRFSKRTGMSILLACAVASLILSEWAARRRPDAAFYLLPTRAWELLLGGLICYAPSLGKSWVRAANLTGLLGATMIAAAAIGYDSRTVFPGLSAAVPCLGAALVIHSGVSSTTGVARLLCWRPLHYVGLISYSLYLWHWPLLSFLSHLYCDADPPAWTRFAAIGSSFVLAAASHRFIETPFRKRVVAPSSRELVRGFALASAALLLVAGWAAYSDGVPGRFSSQVNSLAAAKESKAFINNVTLGEAKRGEFPTFGSPDASRRCLIWGDSHAISLIPGLDAACKARNVLGYQATYSATPPIQDFVVMDKLGLNVESPQFNRAVFDFVVAKQVEVVVLAGLWSDYVEMPGFERRLEQTVVELMQTGVEVAVVRDVVRHKGDVPLLLSMAARRGHPLDEVFTSSADYIAANNRCDEVFQRLSRRGVRIVDPEPYLTVAGRWPAQIDGVPLYRDAHHLTIEGALRLAPLFEQLFDALPGG